jgi:hypothetical protein
MLGCGRIGFDAAGANNNVLGVDASSDAMDATSVGCPTTLALSDDFTSTSPLPFWTLFLDGANVTSSQGAGVLMLTFGAGLTPPGSGAGYTQTMAIDYSEACAIVELDALPNSGSTSLFVGVSGAFVEFVFSAGVMSCYGSTGGIGDQRPWDPVAHKFLRLRAHANAWYWDVSPDGVTYTTLATQSPNTSTTNPTTMTIEVVTPNNVMDGGSAQFRHARVLVP